MYLPYPVLVAINESDKKLVQDYGCKLPNEDTLYVKRDYIYNGASIPRVFWWFGSPYTGRYTRAAFVHDVLYDSNLYSQSDADRVFLEIMDFLRESTYQVLLTQEKWTLSLREKTIMYIL